MFSEGLDSFLTYIRECQAQYRMAQTDEKECDGATQDLLHSLELDHNSDDVMLSISKSISDVRNKRRNAKNRMLYLQPIVDWASKNKNVLDELSRVLGAVRKEERRVPSRVYVRRTSVLDHLDEYRPSEDVLYDEILDWYQEV